MSCASRLDRAVLINQGSRSSTERNDHIQLVVTFHPALSVARDILMRLHIMLESSEEYRKLFKDQPLVVLSCAPNLKDSLARARLPKF